MADLKISALTASTTPLAGTEVLPIVQSSTTKQVSVANLTAGRAVSVASVAITGGSSAPGVISKDATTGLQIRGLAGSGYDLELTNSSGLTSMTVATGTYKTKFWDDVSTLGNVVISTSGKGIDFSATSGTGTSELLADYEEGTWTPLISANGAGVVNFTSTAAIGRYTKVGRLVTVYCRYTYTSIGSVGNDFAFMSGLPFASANSGTEITGSMQLLQSSFDTKNYQPKMTNNGSLILFQYDNGAGTLYAGAPYMVGNSFPGSGDITILLSYFTA